MNKSCNATEVVELCLLRPGNTAISVAKWWYASDPSKWCHLVYQAGLSAAKNRTIYLSEGALPPCYAVEPASEGSDTT